MKLQNITPLAFNKLCDKPLYIDRTVSKEVVKTIVDHFMVNGIFIEEVKLTEEERMNLNNITLAFKIISRLITSMREFIGVRNVYFCGMTKSLLPLWQPIREPLSMHRNAIG